VRINGILSTASLSQPVQDIGLVGKGSADPCSPSWISNIASPASNASVDTLARPITRQPSSTTRVLKAISLARLGSNPRSSNACASSRRQLSNAAPQAAVRSAECDPRSSVTIAMATRDFDKPAPGACLVALAAERLMDEALVLARRPANAVRAIKHLVYQGASLPFKQGMAVEKAEFLSAATQGATRHAMLAYADHVGRIVQSGREFGVDDLRDWMDGTAVDFDIR